MGATIPKQYLPLCGEPMLAQTLRRIIAVPALDQLIVVLSANDGHWADIDPCLQARVQRVDGGTERSDSVLAGLRHLATTAQPDDLVLVHDAARPCVLLEDIERLIATVRQDPARGGLLAAPVRDTMKRGDAQNRVLCTESRELLWHALTPQLFELGVLLDAMTRAVAAGVGLTDEASAVEWAGGAPVLVEGSGDNVKVTRSGDLRLAGLLLGGVG